MSTANQRQIGGLHYKKKNDLGLEHWDVVDLFNLDYFQGQITKYVMRWRDKGGLADLEKARHFLDKYIELEKNRIARSLIEQAKAEENGKPENSEPKRPPIPSTRVLPFESMMIKTHYGEYQMGIGRPLCKNFSIGDQITQVSNCVTCIECQSLLSPQKSSSEVK